MGRGNKTATFLFLMKGGPVELQQLFVSTRNKVIQTTMQPVYHRRDISIDFYGLEKRTRASSCTTVCTLLYLLAQGVLHPVAGYMYKNCKTFWCYLRVGCIRLFNFFLCAWEHILWRSADSYISPQRAACATHTSTSSFFFRRPSTSSLHTASAACFLYALFPVQNSFAEGGCNIKCMRFCASAASCAEFKLRGKVSVDENHWEFNLGNKIADN